MLFKALLGSFLFLGLWFIGFKSLKDQLCHATNSHMLVYHHINDKFENAQQDILKRLSFNAFTVIQGCPGFYRQKTKNLYKFYGLNSPSISLLLNIPGEL